MPSEEYATAARASLGSLRRVKERSRSESSKKQSARGALTCPLYQVMHKDSQEERNASSWRSAQALERRTQRKMLLAHCGEKTGIERNAASPLARRPVYVLLDEALAGRDLNA